MEGWKSYKKLRSSGMPYNIDYVCYVILLQYSQTVKENREEHVV